MPEPGELAITAEKLDDLDQRLASGPPDLSGLSHTEVADGLLRLADIFDKRHRNHVLLITAAERLRG